ncbi:MAG: hypothetical protein ABIQ40_00705 [Bacteroidia bacterium]
MKSTLTLSQLVRAVAAASDDTTASTLFQELYGRICDQFYKAFYGKCYKAFKLKEGSVIAEDVYYAVLGEMERDIRKGKFTVGEEEEDGIVLKRLLARMCLKAYWRILNAYKKNKRKATISSADLTSGQNRIVESTSTGNGFDEEMIAAQDFVYAKLSVKDADIIRTYFCSTLSKEDAQELLMQRYGIPSDAAFERAVARAKERFKAFLYQYQTGKIPDK